MRHFIFSTRQELDTAGRPYKIFRARAALNRSKYKPNGVPARITKQNRKTKP